MDAVLAGDLNTIHGRIGRLEQAFRCIGDIGQRRNANRRRHPVARAALGQEDEPLDAVAQATGHRLGAVDAGLGQENGELVAAEPRNDVGFARARRG